MNELMDRRLKKMNHNVKYQKVPMDEQEVNKLVNKVTKQTSKPTKNWARAALPVPAVAVLAFVFFQLNYQPPYSSANDISLLSQRSINTEMKSQQLIENEEAQDSIEQASEQGERESSTIVRQTYIIHNDNMFVQTGKRVEKSDLKESLGSVKPENSLDQQRGNSVNSEERIYSIQGVDEQRLVAIKSRRSTGIGSSSISQQGYFIFEREDSLPIAQ